MKMTEILAENYQSEIYWAALNAEQARERAANAELDYWIARRGKDCPMASVEHAARQSSTVDNGPCIGAKAKNLLTEQDVAEAYQSAPNWHSVASSLNCRLVLRERESRE
jgi:hypothetical protein